MDPPHAEENEEEEEILLIEERERRLTLILLYIQEVVFLLALIFTSYTAIYTNVTKEGSPPSAKPFFPPESVVEDHYQGEMDDVVQKLTTADLSFVMYYAPWDSESQTVRMEFNKTAQLLQEEIYFTAISCWSPETQCRKFLPKIMRFPMLMAYRKSLDGLVYLGPRLSPYMISFLRNMLHPVQRVANIEQLADLVVKHNVIVIGAFVFEGNRPAPGFKKFHSSAIKMLEKDPFHDIAFALTTDEKTAKSFGLDPVPSIRLYIWNITYSFPMEKGYVEDDLISWILSKVHQVVFWVSPRKLKSKLLYEYLSAGPAVVMFTPRNPLYAINPMFNLFREVSLRYHNCKGHPWITPLADYIYLENFKQPRLKFRNEYHCKKREKRGRRWTMVPASFYDEDDPRETMTTPDPLANVTSKKHDVCEVGSPNSKYFGPQREVCYKKSKKQLAYEKILLQQKLIDEKENNLKQGDRDTARFIEYHEDLNCKLMNHADNYFELPYPDYSDADFKASIDGLACVNNRTLMFIALDSLIHYQFAEGLGINIHHVEGYTAVAIINLEEETQYVLPGEVTRNALIEFIRNHTENTLPRYLRSTHDKWARSVTRYRYPVREPVVCYHNTFEACVPELDARNFTDFVMDNEYAAVVFYYSPYCAMCRGVSHYFLLLSRYLRYFPMLKFARIDGDYNDLPWEYTMDSIPAVIFFPTIHKNESRIFDSNTEFTTANLLNFVVSNLELEAKIPAMISICKSFENLQTKFERYSCKERILKEVYDSIEKLGRKENQMTREIDAAKHFSFELKLKKNVYTVKINYFQDLIFLLKTDYRARIEDIVVEHVLSLYEDLMDYLREDPFYEEFGASY